MKIIVLLLSAWLVLNGSTVQGYTHGGRSEERINERFERVQQAKANHASLETLFNRCGGKVSLEKDPCRTLIGRPEEDEWIGCDIKCCMEGFKTGHCGVVIRGTLGATTRPECICTNDAIDIRCGRDGSLLGIRCPFDKSSCRRMCCREGKAGGQCTGTFNAKCTCDETPWKFDSGFMNKDENRTTATDI